MSVQDYIDSREIFDDYTWGTLVMALMRKADSGQLVKLQQTFPTVYKEFHYRYWSGGGLMPGESGYDPANDDNVSISLPAEEHHP